MHFVRSVLPGTKLTDDENPVLMARLDSLFQILFFIVHNDLKPTPMHVNLVQTIHNLTRSKELIEILNTLGFCFGYKKMKNIDFAIAKRITSLLGPNDRVPLAPVFTPVHPISGAMDNFDHIERNLSGKGSSHDTVLVLFQTVPVNDTSPSNLEGRLKEILPCQQLLYMGDYRRGTIPDDFIVPEGKFRIGRSYEKRIEEDYFLWILCRNQMQKSHMSIENEFVPSFTAIRSKFDSKKFHPTLTSFVPILPYKATERDSIFTTMVNFQDVLRQHGQQYGFLWCDEGVYCIAKEIQFLKPEKFSNLFIGLGRFHFEKIVYGCVGSYLKQLPVYHLCLSLPSVLAQKL